MTPKIDFHDVALLEITPLRFYPAGSQPGFWAREIVIWDDFGKAQRITLYAPSHPALTLAHEQKPESIGETK